MKIHSIICAALLLLVSSCAGGKKTTDLAAARAELETAFSQIAEDASLTMDQKMDKLKPLMTNAYTAHKDDSLGAEIFVSLITNFCEPEEALKLYEESSDLVKNDKLVKTKIDAFRKAADTAVGKTYKEVVGEDALTGKPLSLSSFVGGEKPLLVDFWASWCGPCRKEIKGHLLDLAASGKVNIVGVAVWERSVDDTKGAMKELGITWPVIFAGGRENSPTVEYGIVGIPTLVLIAPDGTILGRGHSVEDLPL